ncbi:F-actin-capping protein subunit beta [Cryptosporidium felis]|nr:F-actin-capping protein subunit beta [Cryptosporidium felis]
MYYIGCNTNRVENYFRSPYSNNYYIDPKSQEEFSTEKAQQLKDSFNELSHLKMLENEFQNVYQIYCQNYACINSGFDQDFCDHGILLSNVYCYDLEGDSFGTCFAMKHIINPFKFDPIEGDEAKTPEDFGDLIYYLDTIHNVETVLSHASGISTYKIGSTFYFGFRNKEPGSNLLNFDGCKTNWTEKKCEFNTAKFTKAFNRSNTKSNFMDTGNENNIQNIALDRNSITIINNQTLYYHLVNIGKLIESVDNNIIKQIQHVLIDNISNLSNQLRH